MNKCIATYGELMDMLDKELSSIHFLIQVLPGADFEAMVHAIRSDDLSPKTLAELVIGGSIQVVHPDEARQYHTSHLMQIDSTDPPHLIPITNRSLCRIEGYEAAVFFQVLDGQDN